MSLSLAARDRRIAQTVVKSVARRSGSRRYARQKAQKNFPYVPQAYRPVQPSNDETDSREVNSRAKQYTPFPKSAGVIHRERILSAKEKEGRLLGLHQAFVRVAKEYQATFSSEPVADMESLRNEEIEDWKDEKMTLMRAVMKHMQTIMKQIHNSPRPVEWSQIERTEDLFRGICRLTHDITILAAELYTDERTEVPAFLELAESGLRDLVKFQDERALLVDAIRTWSPQARVISSTTLLDPAAVAEEETARRPSGFKGWVQRMVASFPGKSPEEEQDEKMIVSAKPLAHEDLSVGATPALFRTVMEAVLFRFKQKFEPLAKKDVLHPSPGDDTDDTTSFDGNDFEYTSTRMVDLLDLMPVTAVPDFDIVNGILGMLSRVGTIESARKSYQIYRKYPSIQARLRFSSVLESFVEAAKKTGDTKELSLIVREVLAVLEEMMNSNVRFHRVERIEFCSIVLNCMAIAGPDAVRNICGIADHWVKRALGKEAFQKLSDQISSGHGRVDNQTLPLVHFLVMIYSSVGDEERFSSAQRMLHYMTRATSEGVRRFVVYPNKESFNAVLGGLLRHESNRGSKSDDETATTRYRFKYAMGLLDYMLTSKEMACWPNEATFALLFRLLHVMNVDDAGQLAEDLLSKMEVRRSFKSSHDVKISLSAYHHILRCWLEVAKSSEARDVCEKALELLTRLEVQSKPLLMNDAEAYMVRQKLPVYDIALRPNRGTYWLALQICAETQNFEEREKAIEISEEIYRRMVDQRITPTRDIEVLMNRWRDPSSADSFKDSQNTVQVPKRKKNRKSRRTKKSKKLQGASESSPNGLDVVDFFVEDSSKVTEDGGPQEERNSKRVVDFFVEDFSKVTEDGGPQEERKSKRVVDFFVEDSSKVTEDGGPQEDQKSKRRSRRPRRSTKGGTPNKSIHSNNGSSRKKSPAVRSSTDDDSDALPPSDITDFFIDHGAMVPKGAKTQPEPPKRPRRPRRTTRRRPKKTMSLDSQAEA